MGVPIMSKILLAFRPSSPDADPAAAGSEGVRPMDEKKGVSVNAAGANSREGSQEAQESQEGQESQDELHPDENLQSGVKKVEAVTLTWSRTSLIAVFINIWLIYLVNAFESTILWSLIPYVASQYEAHSELNVVYIVSDAMSAAMFIPLSKILDLWGRAEGFFVMTCFVTLGMILMAACDNLPTFCAGYVFFNIGFMGVTYCVDVITADASKVKNRGLAYAFTSSPYMITAFAGPKVADEFLNKVDWRWAFGSFAIIFPVVATPLFFILKYNFRKAQKTGVVVPEKSGRTMLESGWHYIVEFDALGVFLFSAGLTVFLLPFSLAASAPEGWKSGYIIAMIIIGFFTLVAFGIYEALFAPKPMINFKLLSDRTVIGTCCLGATYQISYYCWANYFTSFLQVVNNVSVAQAGYISNTFNVVSGFFLLLVGFSIRKTGYFKWLLYVAIPLYIFWQGLMIYFRQPNQSVGYLVMCQVFISIGGSIFIIVQQVAILAAVDRQYIAAVMALLYVVGTTGGAIGATVSGAIWSNTFPVALARFLPEDALADIDMISADLEFQLAYEVGSAARIAVQEAYCYAQTRMLAAGAGIMVLAVVWTLLIRNINVAKVAQTKGTLF